MSSMRPGWLIRPEGRVPYDVANEAMHALAERRLAGEIPDTVILLEHPPVFTAGRRAKPERAPVVGRGGRRARAEVRRIDRGGSFTFHGPGQLVGYPILRPRRRARRGRVPAPDRGHRDPRGGRPRRELGRRPDVQTGVWSGDDKVCAIGVRLMRTRVTLHGFALNCDPDLSWFDGIVACGLPDHGVTSLSRIAGRDVTVLEVQPILERHLADVFQFELLDAPADVAAGLQPHLVP